MVNRAFTIDASTLLNLLATGEAESILRFLPVDKVVCSAVRDEVLYVRSANPEDAAELISINPLVEAGLLTLANLESAEEEAQFVNLAATLDDGEAMSLAISISRGYALVTDDKKARRVAGELPNPVPLLATSELVAYWAQGNSIDPARIREVLASVDLRARFRPWTGYPLRDWWLEVLRDPM